MKKTINILLILSLLFSFLIPPVYAVEIKKGMVVTANGEGVRVRENAGTTFAKISGLDDGDYVNIVDTVKTVDGSKDCPSNDWYKIISASATSGYGYVCSDFVKLVEITNPSYNFEEELAKFPESYRNYILKLHELYPNAMFKAVNATNSKRDGSTLMNFNTALDNEVGLGKSLIWDSNGSRDGLKHLSSYNYDTNKFANNYSGGGVNWYAASREIIAYNMDPRNFLKEDAVFMFEYLGYSEEVHSKEGIESILKGSFMYDTYVDGKEEKKFSDVILEAGIRYSISPYFIASRIIQEVGTTRSSLVLGTYPNYPQYNGYYNFYNISATGDQASIVTNGLNKAIQEGWNSEEKAIIGGAKIIAESYVSKGQSTGYFQKWDVQCGNKTYCFSFQYMQNIEAPSSEGRKTYRAYKSAKGAAMYLDSYLFYIPVYQNMPESTYYPSEASPINYLSSLVIDGVSVPNFHGLTLEYDITVPAGTTNIHIEAQATAKDKGATVSNIGNVAITDDKQDVLVNVKAANGSTRTYTIHVKRLTAEESHMTLEETINNIKSGVINDNYISGLTSFDTLKDAIVKANPATLLTVKNNDGNVVTSGNLATGYQVTLTVGSEIKTFEVIIYGDNSGDGEITILDLLRVQKNLLKANNLTAGQIKASDVNKDGVVDILDLLLVQKHILGSKHINQ